jgi:hypothetical protein
VVPNLTLGLKCKRLPVLESVITKQRVLHR